MKAGRGMRGKTLDEGLCIQRYTLCFFSQIDGKKNDDEEDWGFGRVEALSVKDHDQV